MTMERLNAKPTRWTTLLGLVLVPVLVAGGLLWANWNDDARLRTVEAAIVNLDEPVTLNGEYVPLGRQLTAALVDSDRVQNLNWELASEADARQGLATGQYAAMVTIPPEFSAAATSYAGDAADATSATIGVETSPVAGIADATLGKVVAQEAARVLNETLTSAYLDQIYIGFNDMGDQFVTIADGAAELADGAEQLADGIGQASDGSVQLADGTSELASGLQTMADETSSMPKDTRKLADGVATYVEGVNQLADQTIESVGLQGELVSGIGQLSQGASGIAAGIGDYQQAMSGLASNGQLVAAANDAAAQQAQSSAVQNALAGAADQAAAEATPAAQQAAEQAAPCPSEIEAAGGCAFYEAGRTAGVAVGVGAGAQAGAQAGLQVGLGVGVPVGVGAAGQAAAAGLSQTDPATGESLLSGA
ncbi:MAG: YhgE/Pip family protein, partial [Propionicimonas sp.]|nr:YhgE/Pip family protein [Propionicimonas sp.]